MTTEILVAVIADLNSMNIEDATIDAVAFVAYLAPFHSISISDTVITPDFVDATIIIVATYFGDTVEASIIFTLKALFHSRAVHTIPMTTGRAFPLPTTIQAVALVAVIAHGTHAISIILFLLLTLVAVVFHAIIASEILCSILIFIHSQHMTITRKIAVAFQANICSATQIIIVTG